MCYIHDELLERSPRGHVEVDEECCGTTYGTSRADDNISGDDANLSDSRGH